MVQYGIHTMSCQIHSMLAICWRTNMVGVQAAQFSVSRDVGKEDNPPPDLV